MAMGLLQYAAMLTKLMRIALLLIVFATVACSRPEPLTEEKAKQIVSGWMFKKEPVYAEVPQRVWWTPESPKDDYDELAVRTLRNLEREGLVTVTEKLNGTSAEYIAKVTKKGFPVLGTAPSHRGPVYRATICEKVYDGLRNFERHPHEPTVGAAELVWHYDNPRWTYPLFETKINKPLKKPFVSNVSFWYDKHQWKFEVTVRKTAG